jgi:hypothetical protein
MVTAIHSDGRSERGNRLSQWLAAVTVGLSIASPVWGYETDTHKLLTQIAAGRSVLGVPSSPVLAALQCSGTAACSPSDVAKLGQAAIDEDNGLRVLGHFYDAQNPPLSGGAPFQMTITFSPYAAAADCVSVTALDLPELCGLFFSSHPEPANADSVSWILSGAWQTDPLLFQNPLGPLVTKLAPPHACGGTVGDYVCSYAVAKGAYLSALTKETPSDRNLGASQLFQNLGHVLHHIEDMAQPQHVRNDVHCDSWLCTLLRLVGAQGLGTKSAYEEYVNSALFSTNALVSINAAVASGPQPLSALPNPPFVRPDDFWSTPAEATRRGMADYASNNFLSVGTSGTAMPVTASSGRVQIDLIPDPNHSFPNSASNFLQPVTVSPSCTALLVAPKPASPVYFNGVIVDEESAGGTSSAAYVGGFSAAQIASGAASWPVVQDCVTYDSAMYLLLPQAIRYSAWFIDFLFRGSMSASLDSSGNLTVTNNSTTEPMNGTFTLYADDSSGNRIAVGSCPSPLNVAPNSSNPSGTCPLGSLSTPPPSGSYLLVFSGALGSETSQVAVATVAAASTGCPADLIQAVTLTVNLLYGISPGVTCVSPGEAVSVFYPGCPAALGVSSVKEVLACALPTPQVDAALGALGYRYVGNANCNCPAPP